MRKEEKLKPCPFCGSKDVSVFSLTKGSWVQCTSCNIGHQAHNWTKEYAIRTWNTRSNL